MSVQVPTEDWLCRKLSKLNLTLVEGYHSRSSEARGLLKDQFLRPAKSQAKWYGLFSDQKVDPSAVSDASKPIQSDSSHESAKPESPCLAPRTSATKEQGFFEAVQAEIEAPQEYQPDQSM